MLPSCAGGSGSQGGARHSTKKSVRKGKRLARPIDKEVTVPTKLTRRQKSKYAKERLAKPLNIVSLKDFVRLSNINPYATPRVAGWTYQPQVLVIDSGEYLLRYLWHTQEQVC